jgi:probable addiction module antidote protein
MRMPEISPLDVSSAEDENPDVLLRALAEVAKARGMAQVARDAGLGRESLYKALAPGSHPRFETINAVLRALGVRFIARPPEKKVGSSAGQNNRSKHGGRGRRMESKQAEPQDPGACLGPPSGRLRSCARSAGNICPSSLQFSLSARLHGRLTSRGIASTVVCELT